MANNLNILLCFCNLPFPAWQKIFQPHFTNKREVKLLLSFFLNIFWSVSVEGLSACGCLDLCGLTDATIPMNCWEKSELTSDTAPLHLTATSVSIHHRGILHSCQSGGSRQPHHSLLGCPTVSRVSVRQHGIGHGVFGGNVRRFITHDRGMWISASLHLSPTPHPPIPSPHRQQTTASVVVMSPNSLTPGLCYFSGMMKDTRH